MKHPGIITFMMLVDNPDKLKHYLLLYDELWIPDLAYLDSPGDYGSEESYQGILADLQWLKENEQVRVPPVSLDSAAPDEVTQSLMRMHEDAWNALERTYSTAKEAALQNAVAAFNIDIALSRLVTYLLFRTNGDLAYPVIFPYAEREAVQVSTAKRQSVLSLILNQFPSPDSDLPLEDIVSFKQDSETKYKYKKLWDWIRKFGEEKQDRHELTEEIESLLTEYRYHLKHLTKKVKTDRLKVWVSLPGDMAEDLVKFRWGNALGRIFELSHQKIVAHEEEMKLPGYEMAYVKESIDLLSPRRESRTG